jgi:arylsulfatase A-like enzyme
MKFLSVFVAFCIAAECGLANAQGPVTRPNILLVVNDDQGYGDASCFGSPDLKTPHFDALASSGIRFTRFRVNPLCAPTRASMLTGLSNLESGMWRGPSQREESDRVLQMGVRLLPQYLQEAGYATGIFGKWHLGYKSPDLPLERGFDQFVGFLGGAHPYRSGRGGRLLSGTQPLVTGEHTTDLFADRAEQFIRDNAQRPFFCYVPFNAVHGPLRSPDRPLDSAKAEWLARYNDPAMPANRRDYCAVLSHADDRLGRLLALLDELGLRERTLVICISDNGALTDKFPGNNGPLRGAKGTTYEGGIRVPAAIAWPGVIPAGSVSDANAVHFDLFATILEAAGVAIPERNGRHAVSGISLLEHLRSGGKQPLPDRYLFWDLFGKMAAVHGDWKLVGMIDNHHGKWDAALAQIERTRFELYDLKQDLSEQHDLAGEQPAVYRDLKERYLAWFRAATR